MTDPLARLTAVTVTLRAADARRISVAAQGFGRAPGGAVGTRRLRGAIERMATLQIDSVNVFARSHYLPLFARLGPYDPADLDRVLFTRGAPFAEFWAHMASFIPREDWGLFAFRMAEARERYGGAEDSFLQRHRDVVAWVRAELADRGPWWDWDVVKETLEILWLCGEVAIAGRRGFERTYALAEQVIPEPARTPVPRADAIRELTRLAARAYGVASAADLADYWRIRDRPALKVAIGELVDAGELRPVHVEGWTSAGRPLAAWRHRDAVRPRSLSATAVLTPFDPLVWFRDRASRLFDFDYRIEIYTPADKRRYGYYSLPVLIDDDVVGRVDLKADRAASRLLVQSAWWEHGHPRRRPSASPRTCGPRRSGRAWRRSPWAAGATRRTSWRGRSARGGTTASPPVSRQRPTTSTPSHRASSAISASTASAVAVSKGTSSCTACTRSSPALRSVFASSFPTNRSPCRIGRAK